MTSGTTSGSASGGNDRRLESLLLIQEFNNLIGKYHAYCVAPVFGRLPESARGQLSKSDISKLNGFHHKFQSFTSDYTHFLRLIAESHPELEHLPRYLPNTDPL
jgi:hypothetical protein